MKINQSAVPFLLLLLFMVVGIPLLDRKIKAIAKNDTIEIRVEESMPVMAKKELP